jgi:hypothetical protein
LTLLLAVPRPVLARAQAAVDALSPAPVPAPPPSNPPSPSPGYVYAPDGRRDPFVSLVTPGVDKPPRIVTPQERPDGVGGLAVNDIVVRGLVENRGGWLAMVGAPGGKTYSIRVGDKLFDGNVRSITADAVVLMQDVTDPKSLERQREVRKPLRGNAQ